MKNFKNSKYNQQCLLKGLTIFYIKTNNSENTVGKIKSKDKEHFCKDIFLSIWQKPKSKFSYSVFLLPVGKILPSLFTVNHKLKFHNFLFRFEDASRFKDASAYYQQMLHRNLNNLIHWATCWRNIARNEWVPTEATFHRM